MKKITLFLLFLFQLGFAQNTIQFYQNTPVSGSSFGYSLAVDNDEILASSGSWTFGPPSIGKTFLFSLSDGALTQSHVFLPDEALIDDNFGSALAIQDNTIAIGALGRDDNFEDSGAVYVYQKNAGTYEYLQKITAFDGGIDGHFGSSVKISNNQLFIRSANSATTGNPDDGAVYIYNYNGSDWVFYQKIVTDGTSKIDVENNLLVTSDYNQNEQYASVSFYKKNGSSWEFASMLPLGNLEEDVVDFSLSDNNVYAISRNFNGSTNITEYQETINGEWGLYNYFTIDDHAGDQVYTKIEVSGDKMFLGSTWYILQMTRKFPVLYYKKTDGAWSYQNQFTGTGPYEDDYFGNTFASEGDSLIIGAPNDGPPLLNGRAYYLNLNTLATRDFEKKSAFIYPNPTQNKIHIETNSTASVKKVSVLSITGNVLFETTRNRDEVSLEKLADGIYFAKLSFSDSTEQTFKIIKN